MSPRKVARTKTKILRLAPGPTNGATIEDALKEVQAALSDAQAKIASVALPAFTSATITLQTLVTVSGGVKVSFLIFSFGQTWEKERAHEIQLVVVPVNRVGLRDLATPPSLSAGLIAAMVDAAEGVKAAQNATPHLNPKSLKVTISFTVTEEVGGGLKLEPIYLELSGKLKNKALHKIEMQFG
jgi:hypothetical protein